MTNPIHICHMTSVHHPSDIRIFRKECITLSDAGYSVTLVAASSDQVEAGSGINVINLGASGGRLFRMTVTAYRVFRTALRLDADCYHMHDAELMPWGLVLRLFGKKVVFDAHEDISKQIYSKHWVPGFLKGFISRIVWLIEFLFLRFFNACVAATPAIANALPHKSVVVVQNFPFLSELSPPTGELLRRDEVVYVGGLTEARCAREIIAALERVNNVRPITLHLVGKVVPDALFAELKSHAGWKYVVYHGWCDRSTVSRIMSECSAGLVVFKAHPNHVNAQPNKLFEYMSAKLPVIASDFPLWRQIVETASAGYLVDPDDPQDIAKAIGRIFEYPAESKEMGERGRLAVEKMFNWELEKEKLIQLYKDLLQ